jgi:uncharacterized membrane protein YfcA
MGTGRLCRVLWLLVTGLSFTTAAPALAGEPAGGWKPPPVSAGPHAHLQCGACHDSLSGPVKIGRDSPIGRKRIADVCGGCHPREQAVYAAGSHGRGVARGDTISPTCVSCHGAHGIRWVRDPAAPTSPLRVVFTCAQCHEDPAILRATNLPYTVVEQYQETFHGIAQASGIARVATCVSCHGPHAVLPASDPHSRVSSANLEATCQSCHPAVTADMVAAVQHPGGGLKFSALLDTLRIYVPTAGAAVNSLLASGMGMLVGFLSGLFGVGGGFLMTPLLIFIGISPAVAAATDAAQITAGATSGAISHSRLGNVDFKMGLVIVLGGWIGGYVGVQLVHLLRNLGNFDFVLRLVYVLVLSFIGITMFWEGLRALRGRSPRKEPTPGRLTRALSELPLQVSFPKSGLRVSALLPASAGFAVGVLAAFLGVGGGFIMLPTMIYIIGLPTRMAVGTDLFQIVLTSANVTLQQAVTNHTVDLVLTVTLFIGSTIGAQFGVLASRRLRGEQIRVFLAVIVLAVMGVLLYQLITPPAHLIDFAKAGGGH